MKEFFILLTFLSLTASMSSKDVCKNLKKKRQCEKSENCMWDVKDICINKSSKPVKTYDKNLRRRTLKPKSISSQR